MLSVKTYTGWMRSIAPTVRGDLGPHVLVVGPNGSMLGGLVRTFGAGGFR